VPTSLTASAAAAASQLRDSLRATVVPSESFKIRESQARVDVFLAASSKHVMAVEAVLVGAARREIGDARSRELNRACHRLQLALRTMHARRWGSSTLMRIPWGVIRREVDERLESLLAVEESVSAELDAVLSTDDVAGISDHLEEAELRAPTRPHPYLPRRGLGARMAHRAASRADAFWDGVQGRVLPASGGSSS